MQLSPYSIRESPDKIWFLCRARGDSQVRGFIGQLDEQTRWATWRLLDQTEVSGPPRRIDRFRHLTGDVFEFKVHQTVAVRYLTFRANVGWVITLAMHKPGKARLQRLIQETQHLHDEYERFRP